jgi:hypothetical protein
MTKRKNRKNPSAEAPNRVTRRREQFRPDEAAAERAMNPAFGTGDDSKSYAGRPDQGIVRTTGPGTGGATQSDDRVKHHEGVHRGNLPNS